MHETTINNTGQFLNCVVWIISNEEEKQISEDLMKEGFLREIIWSSSPKGLDILDCNFNINTKDPKSNLVLWKHFCLSACHCAENFALFDFRICKPWYGTFCFAQCSTDCWRMHQRRICQINSTWTWPCF